MERQPYKFLILEQPKVSPTRSIPRSSSEEFFDTEPYEDGPSGSDDIIKVTPTDIYDDSDAKLEEATYQTTRGPVTFQWVTYHTNARNIRREHLTGLFGVVFTNDEIEAQWAPQFPSYIEHINIAKIDKVSIPNLINKLVQKFTADDNILVIS